MRPESGDSWLIQINYDPYTWHHTSCDVTIDAKSIYRAALVVSYTVNPNRDPNPYS